MKREIEDLINSCPSWTRRAEKNAREARGGGEIGCGEELY